MIEVQRLEGKNQKSGESKKVSNWKKLDQNALPLRCYQPKEW
jgi:hypothetical protein